MSFRRYGGLNYAPKNNIMASNYNNINNLSVSEGVGQPNSYINFLSDISGNININGNFDISGNLHVAGNIDCSGNENIDGNVDISGNLHVAGDIDCSGNENIDGNVDISGNLYVGGDIDCSGTIITETLVLGGQTQTSTYTGAGGASGSYTNANITIDTNGKITAISNGVSSTPNLNQVLTSGNAAGNLNITGVNNLQAATINGLPYPVPTTTYSAFLTTTTALVGSGSVNHINLAQVTIAQSGLYIVQVYYEFSGTFSLSTGVTKLLRAAPTTSNSALQTTITPTTIAYNINILDTVAITQVATYLLQINANTTYYLGLDYYIPSGTSVDAYNSSFNWSNGFIFTRLK